MIKIDRAKAPFDETKDFQIEIDGQGYTLTPATDGEFKFDLHVNGTDEVYKNLDSLTLYKKSSFGALAKQLNLAKLAKMVGQSVEGESMRASSSDELTVMEFAKSGLVEGSNAKLNDKAAKLEIDGDRVVYADQAWGEKKTLLNLKKQNIKETFVDPYTKKTYLITEDKSTKKLGLVSFGQVGLGPFLTNMVPKKQELLPNEFDDIKLSVSDGQVKLEVKLEGSTHSIELPHKPAAVLLTGEHGKEQAYWYTEGSPQELSRFCQNLEDKLDDELDDDEMGVKNGI